MYRETWYRALCFGKPIAPWRSSKERAQRDLEAKDLGCFDDWGKFWVTVPGDLEKKHKWVDQSKAA